MGGRGTRSSHEMMLEAYKTNRTKSNPSALFSMKQSRRHRCAVREKLRSALHRLLLGKRERCSWAGGREARVGVGGLVGRMLLIGVLRQEGDGRIGWSGLRLREGFRVTGALVAHDFSGIQLLWTPSRVLPGAEQTHTTVV